MALTIRKSEVLKILSETYHDIPTWMLFQVILPLLLIGLAVLPLWIVQRIKSAYAYIFGNGAFFIFAILLLTGVFSTVIQARNFSTRLGRSIKLSYLWAEGLIMLVAFIFVFLYAVNICHIYDCAIVEKISLSEVLIKLRKWSWYGLIGAGSAIFFVLFELLATKKAILKAR